MSNVPDDWHTYNRRCSRGHRYHASEGGCDVCGEMLEELRDRVAELHRKAEALILEDKHAEAVKLLEEAHSEVEELRW